MQWWLRALLSGMRMLKTQQKALGLPIQTLQFQCFIPFLHELFLSVRAGMQLWHLVVQAPCLLSHCCAQLCVNSCLPPNLRQQKARDGPCKTGANHSPNTADRHINVRGKTNRCLVMVAEVCQRHSVRQKEKKQTAAWDFVDDTSARVNQTDARLRELHVENKLGETRARR